MPRRTFRRWLLAIMAATFVMFAGAVSPASADQGDKQGWSLGSDPRKRVFLRFVPANDGPRVLVLGCLRDMTVSSSCRSKTSPLDMAKPPRSR
jgi:hypothetical protein